MLFLDNAAPDSCCAERPLHISTYPRLVSTAATVREKTWEQRHRPTDRPTTRPTDRPTDYNNPSLRMRARGLITSLASQPYFSAYAHARAKVGGGGKEIVSFPLPLSRAHAHTRKNTAGSRDYIITCTVRPGLVSRIVFMQSLYPPF